MLVCAGNPPLFLSVSPGGCGLWFVVVVRCSIFITESAISITSGHPATGYMKKGGTTNEADLGPKPWLSQVSQAQPSLENNLPASHLHHRTTTGRRSSSSAMGHEHYQGRRTSLYLFVSRYRPKKGIVAPIRELSVPTYHTAHTSHTQHEILS